MIKTDYFFTDSSIPVIALAIHNGHSMPEELLRNCGISDEERLREEDPHTNTIAERFANRIIVHDSRFMVDLNRSPQMAIYQKPEDCWGLPARIKPVRPEYLFYLQKCHQAWYDVLAYQLDRMLLIHPYVFVLDLHSFNHRRGGPNAAPDDQQLNPDIILGRNNLDHRYYSLIEKLRKRIDKQIWQGMELDCRADVKFPGGYLSRWINNKYSGKALCLAVEFKKIWMDEWTGEVYEPAFTELKDIFVSAFSAFSALDLSSGLPKI